jgi:hypothetical protein
VIVKLKILREAKAWPVLRIRHWNFLRWSAIHRARSSGVMSLACFSGNGCVAIGGPRRNSASFAAYSAGDISFASFGSVIV